jgi:hypothetical protein
MVSWAARAESKTWMLVGFVLALGCAADPQPASDETTSTTSSPETTGEPVDCADFTSTPDIGPEVAVTLRQNGIGPVYWRPHGCGAAIPFAVTSIASGEDVPHLLGDCSPEVCDDFVGADACFEECPNCAPPGAARLDIGEVGEGSWSGAWNVPLLMVDQCAAGSGCQSTCQRRDQAPAGQYEIKLEIFKLCTGGCECDDPQSEGPCNLGGGQQLGYPETFTAVIDYPAQTSVEIVIAE